MFTRAARNDNILRVILDVCVENEIYATFTDERINRRK